MLAGLVTGAFFELSLDTAASLIGRLSERSLLRARTIDVSRHLRNTGEVLQFWAGAQALVHHRAY